MNPRALTPDEITLAKTVFGDSIAYEKVKIHDSQFILFQAKGVAMAPEGNLYMYGCYKDNYAAESETWRGHFIHEMTHVWQFQNKILNPIVAAIELNLRHAFNYAAAYDYVLDAKKDLMDYNMEQQASIVQDYFVLKREGCCFHTGHCKNKEETSGKIALYEQVLEKFLKNPAYAKRSAFLFPKKKPKPPKAA